MVQNFNQYAVYYDALYNEKDYAHECSYLQELCRIFSGIRVESVLDLGCGTGKHSHLLIERGYQVFGIDRSQEMLTIAKEKSPSAGAHFVQADLSNFDLDESFDLAISMFGVVSYLINNKQLNSMFTSVHKHLKPGGLFIFDVWHGSAVLHQLPEEREIKVTNVQQCFKRKAVPVINYAQNMVQVDYTISSLENKIISKESHQMRYFFLPELELLAEMHNFSLQGIYKFLSTEKPNEIDWNITVVLKK
jgi:SAM-dependent methyltransferase